MTSPLAHDHPDWGRTVSATDIEVITDVVLVGVGTTPLGRFLVGNLPNLFVSMSVAAGGARLTLIWYDAKTGGTIIGVNRIDTRVGQPAKGSVAVLGPYVELELTADAANRNVTLLVWQSLTWGQDTSTLNAGNLISVDLVVMAASAVRTDNAPQVKWGWGHWMAVMETGAAWFSRLYSVDYQGNATLLDMIGLGSPPGSRLFLLPPMPIRLVTTNADAGAPHNVFLSVNYHVGPL